MYDFTYAPSVAEEQTTLSTPAHQFSIEKGLAFLFGDDA